MWNFKPVLHLKPTNSRIALGLVNCERLYSIRLSKPYSQRFVYNNYYVLTVNTSPLRRSNGLYIVLGVNFAFDDNYFRLSSDLLSIKWVLIGLCKNQI